MRILPISNNVYHQPKNQNFKGITREISSVFVGSGSFGGGQGDYDEYQRTLEYRPFADETMQEALENMKKINSIDVFTPQSSLYPQGVYPTSDLMHNEVVLGEPLNCTKEEAKMILDQLEFYKRYGLAGVPKEHDLFQ